MNQAIYISHWNYGFIKKSHCANAARFENLPQPSTSFREYPYFVAIKSAIPLRNKVPKQHWVPLAKQNRQFP
jgi:hypothetical protein